MNRLNWIAVAILAGVAVGTQSVELPHLIIDTDASTDVDDAMAICMANALEDLGEVRIAAVVHNVGYPKAIGEIARH